MAEADGTDPKQLTHEGDDPEFAAISPDDRYIYYQNHSAFHRVDIDGSGHRVLNPEPCWYPDVSPDGKSVAHNMSVGNMGSEIGLLASDGDHRAFVFLSSPANERQAESAQRSCGSGSIKHVSKPVRPRG